MSHAAPESWAASPASVTVNAMRSDFQRATPAIAVFASVNFVLAGLCLLWILVLVAVIVYGIGFSGDRGAELVEGVVGAAFLAVPGIIGLGVYLVAGIGLVRRRPWGYYFHLAGAVMAALSCLGVIYTVLALVFALRPEFSAAFFPGADRRMPDDEPEAEFWDER
jgi:hypothetical protein